MTLGTTIYLEDARIVYRFDPSTRGHWASWVANSAQIHDDPEPPFGCCGTPGIVINFLTPYRGNREVDKLIAWLSK